jgi:Zn-dependent peptidase ImmA (M78 family)
MNYPPEYRVSARVSVEEAEGVAMAERARLGLGLAPIPDVIKMLEVQVGLRIFTRAVNSRISGVFGYHEKAGGCVLINSTHRAGRQALSAAHEFWHFLTSRHRPEVLYGEHESFMAGDRAANQFAMAFLMPSVAVRQLFESSAAVGKFTPASIFYLAHVFNVSVEAMTRRLEQLELVKPNTWRDLKERGLKVNEVRRMLGLPEPEPRTNAPLRFLALAVDAYFQGELSEGELARMLAVDRLTVREWVDEFGGMAAENRE